ncbi:hypothetical protein MTR67_026618 [Solanum verrucosum]|uniref:Tf2-1-like SH3-like domain-containing protein n=1 Tax=Solanum verrucosum TaxID=315347 RepID=A0AAF0TZU3_SOLVR|nr:hypothetical protein MTR67_026618 [Solanum verrucosum]
MLKNCMGDSSLIIPTEDIGIKNSLSYDEIPVHILDRQILQRVGQVAYELELPSGLKSVHPVFHLSILRKCVGDPYRVVQVEDVQIIEDLSYEETPVVILDR